LHAAQPILMFSKPVLRRFCKLTTQESAKAQVVPQEKDYSWLENRKPKEMRYNDNRDKDADAYLTRLLDPEVRKTLPPRAEIP